MLKKYQTNNNKPQTNPMQSYCAGKFHFSLDIWHLKKKKFTCVLNLPGGLWHFVPGNFLCILMHLGIQIPKQGGYPDRSAILMSLVLLSSYTCLVYSSAICIRRSWNGIVLNPVINNISMRWKCEKNAWIMATLRCILLLMVVALALLSMASVEWVFFWKLCIFNS